MGFVLRCLLYCNSSFTIIIMRLLCLTNQLMSWYELVDKIERARCFMFFTYEWFLEKTMSEIVCIDTRRISGCPVCELQLCTVCVCCDWVDSMRKDGYCIWFLFLSFYISLWVCVNYYCKRKNDFKNRRRKMNHDLMNYAHLFYFCDFNYVFLDP